MKFFYIVIFDGEIESGVNKKANAHVKYLISCGIDATLILIEAGNKSNNTPSNLIKNPGVITKRKNIINRLMNARKIAKVIGNSIRELQTTDVLSIRYPLPTAYYPIIFFKPFRRCKVIFEYNALITQELLLTHFYLDIFLEYFFGFFIRSMADAGIGVTHEITDYERTKTGNRNKPFITIANGIEVNAIQLRLPPSSVDKNTVTMICVANVSPWHGLDRLILGMSHYSETHSVKLHVVGEGMDIQKLKTLCQQKNLSDHVLFHGFLSGSKLDRLFDESHIAVGSLGIHRKGLSQTSELKAREYCARGIPYMVACSDPDFPNDFPYILRIPADESPIDMKQVIRYTSAIYQDPDHPQKMRQYAIEHLDWSIKMKKLKKFLEEVIHR